MNRSDPTRVIRAPTGATFHVPMFIPTGGLAVTGGSVTATAAVALTNTAPTITAPTVTVTAR